MVQGMLYKRNAPGHFSAKLDGCSNCAHCQEMYVHCRESIKAFRIVKGMFITADEWTCTQFQRKVH